MANKTNSFLKNGIRQQLKENYNFDWPVVEGNLVQLSWEEIVDILKKFQLKQIYIDSNGISSATSFRTSSNLMFCHFYEENRILTTRVRKLK